MGVGLCSSLCPGGRCASPVDADTVNPEVITLDGVDCWRSRRVLRTPPRVRARRTPRARTAASVRRRLGVGERGEQGDVDNDYGTGGDNGAGNEGGAGDEVGGGG